MTVRDLQIIYDYGYWGNERLFGVLSQLTPAEFTKDVGGSYGSITNTLVHVLSAEWGWLARCGGPERGPRLAADDFPDLESVTDKWHSSCETSGTYQATSISSSTTRKGAAIALEPEGRLGGWKHMWQRLDSTGE